MTKSYYYERAGALNRELKQAIPAPTLKRLHVKRPWYHFFVAGRQLLLLILMPILIYHFGDQPLVWIPAAVLQGFVVFSFTVLLHEVVHKCVFNKDSYDLTPKLGLLYSVLSGLARSQFHRWHMDHHFQLGSDTDDPKRAHLSPKRNARWYKFLYCTPALYPIYFRAAKKAQATYEPELLRRIAWERKLSIGFHLSVLGCFLYLSPVFALKAYVLPVFFVFPAAFTLNRLGQHYIIDPDDPAKWSTLIQPNPVWNFLFLWSSYHLEHHYFPAVPFYNLKALNRELGGFFRQRGVEPYSYTRLLKEWFWHNHKPHTRPKAAREAGKVVTGGTYSAAAGQKRV
ncbi:Fatty acid desaturase [Sulfidibacter corallicola]|uniref:Fatty acid desaturase n=1 Tax=Sulfidibacter corallicola TaxID=2818388 RepID=A0A8A4TTG4_SULCO|nr:fatty acid desaturase [Sulfidibacter corallicola]QTD52667.1 fatty acid desaturase [Sulfidibacter corallicola]